MKQKKVLYIAETTSGGSAYSLFYLVREIRRKNISPVVLFVQIDNPDVFSKIKSEGIEILTFDKKQSGNSRVNRRDPSFARSNRAPFGDRIQMLFGRNVAEIYFSIKAFCYFLRYQAKLILPIIRIVKRYQIDLIHLNNGLHNGLGAILSGKISGIPIVCHMRMFSKLSKFQKFFIRFVDRFIYISEAVSNHFRYHGIPPQKGIVIYNALDLSEFFVLSDKGEVRREFGWNNGEQIIGIIGRVAEWKGQAYFLQALSKCGKKYPMLRGLIIGGHSHYVRSREYFDHLNSLSYTLGIKDKIIFTGFRSDIPRLISALDVVVHSSIKPEPFGRVVIEGMACGKPVIATSAGGVPEIITDNVTGLLVQCGDSSAMARAIDKVLSDKKMAKTLGNAAQKRVERMFTIQQHAMDILGLYEVILKKLT